MVMNMKWTILALSTNLIFQNTFCEVVHALENFGQNRIYLNAKLHTTVHYCTRILIVLFISNERSLECL